MTDVLAASALTVTVPRPGLLAGLTGDRLTILDGIDLAIGAGETVGLVGESGSGKTTLARALMGLVRIEAGTLAFGGAPVSGPTGWRRLRREAAIMFQDPVGSLSPRLTVGALVTEPLVIAGRLQGERRAAAADLLDLVGLPARIADRYPHELSGGQARRVGVARALALRPRLVIADEPTAGLDMSVQGAVLNLLGEMRERFGLSYLIVTHNLATIRHAADRLVILYLGRVVEEGPARSVFARPFHPYSASLIGAEPIPDPRRRASLVPADGETPSLFRRPDGCEFHTRCPRTTARCRAERPALADFGDGRRVRCHHPLHA